VQVRRGARFAYVPQDDDFPPGATVEQVLAAGAGQRNLDEHVRDRQVEVAITRYKFANPHQPVTELSGGWRKRLAIVAALLTEPDLLLLDEPTNHLDIEGIVWLEELLGNASFAFLVVSHDRYFLEATTNRVIEVNPTYPEGHFATEGTYTEFLERRDAFLEAQNVREEQLRLLAKHEVAFLRSHAKAQRTKGKFRQDQARENIAEHGIVAARNRASRTAALGFDATGRTSKKLLVAKGLSKSLGGRSLFRDVDMFLAPGTRVGLLGRNGTGKTTLIRLLTGQLQPDEGVIERADNLKTVLFDQRREQLDRGLTLPQAFCGTGEHVYFRGKQIHFSGWAKRFMFREDQFNLSVGDLSGGERARILIARLMLQPADILLLDEPTNDLDIPSLDALEENLAEFPGAVVLVSHDRFMLERLCTELLALDGQGNARPFGSLTQWEAAQSEMAAEEAAAARDARRKPKNKLTASEAKDLAEMEDRIAAAEEKAERLRQAFEHPPKPLSSDESQRAWDAWQAARAEIDDQYARWGELEKKAKAS
jgi:ATP-binding cassette subfamily F protein uup